MTVESNFTQHCLTLLSTMQLQVLEQCTYRVLPGPSEQEVQIVQIEDVQVGRHGKGGGVGRVPRLLGGHCLLCLCFGRCGR